MTTIDISDDYVYVTGHSGYAEKGYDIVCSAISVLTESLDRYLRVTGNQVESTKGDGQYTIHLIALNNAGKAIKEEYEKMLDEIINEYSEYVRRK